MTNPTPRQASLELVFASSLWGFGFVATVWAMQILAPAWMAAGRFMLGFLSTLPLAAVMAARSPSFKKALEFDQLRLAAIPGFFLAAGLVVQGWGLMHTTATKSGFITCLYVVFVPVLERMIFKKRIHRLHGFFVAIALTGAALICELSSTSWNKGDLITLASAVLLAGQIIAVGHAGKRIASPVAFNMYQTLAAGICSLPYALAEMAPADAWVKLTQPFAFKPWFGIAFLIYGSTFIAFFLQIRAQRVVTSSVASMLCLLESPFAALAAFWFLGDSLSPLQWVGAALIMATGVATIHFETRK